ncbi:MAG TPA: hypothetical protein VKE74_00545 [Gemmataceae bacterium]|nr:hypothetical protein [Gemmataceae bacterium]
MIRTHCLTFALVLGLVAALFAPSVLGRPAVSEVGAHSVAADDNKPAKPDLIVSDIYLDGDVLVFQIQNQGPGDAPKGVSVQVVVSGKVKEKPVTLTEAVPVPVTPFAVRTVRIPLKKFGADDPVDFGYIVTVEIDPQNTLAEERKTNNTAHRALREEAQPRGEYIESKELPDLVITDITTDGTYLFVHYMNKGQGATGADFLVRFRCGEESFDGNYYYRFPVPSPGVASKTGGLTVGLIGLKRGDVAEVEATIDHEDRVRETDKTNNTFKKTLKIE